MDDPESFTAAHHTAHNAISCLHPSPPPNIQYSTIHPCLKLSPSCVAPYNVTNSIPSKVLKIEPKTLKDFLNHPICYSHSESQWQPAMSDRFNSTCPSRLCMFNAPYFLCLEQLSPLIDCLIRILCTGMSLLPTLTPTFWVHWHSDLARKQSVVTGTCVQTSLNLEFRVIRCRGLQNTFQSLAMRWYLALPQTTYVTMATGCLLLHLDNVLVRHYSVAWECVCCYENNIWF